MLKKDSCESTFRDIASMKKKYLIVVVALGFGIIYSLLCPQLCPSDLHGLDSDRGVNCSPFAPIGSELPVLSSLPLMGLLLLTIITFTPAEFVLSHFKPPRFFS
jgi:hypothetical protein